MEYYIFTMILLACIDVLFYYYFFIDEITHEIHSAGYRELKEIRSMSRLRRTRASRSI